jgi:hypothetical protein
MTAEPDLDALSGGIIMHFSGLLALATRIRQKPSATKAPCRLGTSPGTGLSLYALDTYEPQSTSSKSFVLIRRLLIVDAKWR